MIIEELNPATFNPLIAGQRMTLVVTDSNPQQKKHLHQVLTEGQYRFAGQADQDLIQLSHRELGQLIEDLGQVPTCPTAALDEIYQKQKIYFTAGNQSFDLTEKPMIHSIMNLSPESFFDGKDHNLHEILQRIEDQVAMGVSFFDLGGKSTNPKAGEMSADEEWQRLDPYLKEIKRMFPEIILSIDSNNPITIERSLDQGVQVINSISGFETPAMLDLVEKYQAPVITTYNNRDKATTNIQQDLLDYLDDQVSLLKSRGLKNENIILDPGVGFTSRYPGISKAEIAAEDVKKIQSLAPLAERRLPILVGVSNKSFMKTLFDRDLEDRLLSTLLVEYDMVMNGGRLLRVHQVEETKLLMEIFNTLAL